jgi:hypothetical protein
MSKTSPVLLNDTLNLIQLARETARLQGKQVQAEQLKPVADGLRDLISNAPGKVGSPQPQKPARPSSGGSETSQPDFQALLSAVSRIRPASSLAPSGQERAQIVQAMVSGGMSQLEIARQMGMTREEIGLILQIGSFRRGSKEISMEEQ